MKRLFLIMTLAIASLFVAKAQKFALLDMEYIMKNIPAYEIMNKQLEDQSKKWQAELNKLEAEAKSLYEKYQKDLVFLTAEQKKQREELIVAKEKEAYELKRKYFGPEGELFKKREKLMKPIQDEIWKVLKEIAERNSFKLIIDRSSSKIVYADPSVDISSSVLSSLGFSSR